VAEHEDLGPLFTLGRVGIMQGSMTASRVLSRHVLAPTLDRLRGTHTMRSLKELEESQWWPQERIERLQAKRLQHLVRYAYERVPYYRRLMDAGSVSPDSIRTPADLPLIPVLSKADVREHSNDLLAEGFPRCELLHGRTSGSTGAPMAFYSTKESRWSRGIARSLRALEWAGVYMGDPVFRLASRGHHGFVSKALFTDMARVFTREKFEDPECFSDSSLQGVVERIARSRPRALRGYASSICIVAEFIRESDIPAPEVGAIVTGGEELFPGQRALMREVFGTEPFSKYSSFENYDIAMECDAHAGLHVAAEDLIVEVVDEDGRPLPPGCVGRVLVTSLHEYGMPLIRYCTEDESSFAEGVCTCGRSLPRLSSVIGRTCSAIYTPSGRRLSTNTLDSSGLVPLGIRQFQLVQEQLDHVTVRVVPGTSASSSGDQSLCAQVKSQFSGWLGDDVAVDVAIVDRIAPTPAGKHLYLISLVRPPAQSATDTSHNTAGA